jgi:hypothetical protein
MSKRGSEDQGGSADGKLSKRPREKEKKKDTRPPVKSDFMVRLTAEKTGDDLDQWISGSMDQTPDVVTVLKSKFFCGRLSLEKGKNEGVLHWQIYVGVGKGTRMRCDTVRNFLSDHFEDLMFNEIDYCDPCKNKWACAEYVKKDDTHVCGPWEWNLDVKP